MQLIGDMISIEVAVVEETSGFFGRSKISFLYVCKKIVMSGHHPLQVKEIQRLTDDAVAISFSIPKELRQPFSFKAGQYLTLSHNIDGEQVRRSYSLCSAPHEEVLRVGIKAIPNGLFSNYANRQIKVGDILEVGAPEGDLSMSPTKRITFCCWLQGVG